MGGEKEKEVIRSGNCMNYSRVKCVGYGWVLGVWVCTYGDEIEL